jgi:glycosyltransferase involved in cell wall biosynthesis
MVLYNSKNMKNAFIVTTFNEEATIRTLFTSLEKQVLMPDEIIIVDAFSSDSTFEKIKDIKREFNKRYPKIRFDAYKKRGNRSLGRNYAIKKATGDIIACSDAGCIFNKDWFENLLSPFRKGKVDVVAGFYKPVMHSVFEKCLSTYTCVPEDKVTDDFLPSSRSIAFKKSAWEEVKGYPEDLDTCEDLVFAREMKRKGLKFYVARNAVVLWPQRKNLWEAFWQFFSYAKGDGQALYMRRTTPILFLRYMLGVIFILIILITHSGFLLFVFLFLFICYLLWSVSKNYKYVKRIQAIIYLPLLQLTSDVAVIVGMSIGIVKRMLFSVFHDADKGPTEITV